MLIISSNSEIINPIRIDLIPGKFDSISQSKRLVVSTSDSTEVFPTKEATTSPNGGLEWAVDNARLPVYSRYQSSLVFEVHGSQNMEKLPLVPSAQPKAIAVLWLQELVDDETRDVCFVFGSLFSFGCRLMCVLDPDSYCGWEGLEATEAECESRPCPWYPKSDY